MQPGFAVAITCALVTFTEAILCSRISIAISFCKMLYMPALPQQISAFASRETSGRGWRAAVSGACFDLLAVQQVARVLVSHCVLRLRVFGFNSMDARNSVTSFIFNENCFAFS